MHKGVKMKFKLPPYMRLITKTYWSSQLGLQNILTASLQRSKTPATSNLDMTLNNLMVGLQ